MPRLKTIRIWLRALLRREQVERELAEELRFHLEAQVEANLAAGMSPEEARRRARQMFGGVEQVKEECRDARGVNFLETLVQDVRYGLRTLRKSPGFTAVAVLTLALGIGANTAIFSYVDATWLRPLPVRGSARMVRIFTSEHDSSGEQPRGPSSYVDYLDLRRQATAFAGMLSYEHRGALLYGSEEVKHVPVDLVSPNYFSVLGVGALRGRVFREAEDGTSQPPGVVISYELWRQQFDSDPAIAGRQVRLTNAIVTILGVMPRWFRGLDLQEPAAVWIPPSVWTQMTGSGSEFIPRGNRRREILARLAPGVGLAQAQAQLDTIGSRLAQDYPATNKDSEFTVVPEMETRGENTRQQGLILLGIALGVALIACANLANLQLARAELRRRETATRLALGGGRLRLLRQWLTESLLLAVLGCGLALLMGQWIVDMLPRLFARAYTDTGYDFRLDGRVLLFTIAVAVGTTILFGLAPALQASKVEVLAALRDGPGSGGGGRRLHARDFFLAGQVALAVVLLAGAGLLLRTLEKLQAVDPGFNARQPILMLSVVPELAGYHAPQLHSYYQTVQERLGALPGVEQASLVQRVPFAPSLGGAEKEVQVPGVQPPAGRTGFRVNFDVVGPGYFSLMGTRLLRGRVFGPQDGPNGARVVIVNEAMERRFWLGRGAVGEHLRVSGTDCEVVGVVEDAKWETLTEAPRPLLYLPMTQQVSDGLTILLRTRVDPRSLVSTARAELRRVDRSVPLLSAITLSQHMEYTLNDQRNRARLAAAFAALGLLLAATGIYGVLAYYLTRRTHEIGIRMAVGAEPWQVFRLVLQYGLRRVLAGLAAGLALAVAVCRLLSTLLFGVRPADPATLAGALLLLLLVALAAAYLPARRATRVDPMVALRYE